MFSFLNPGFLWALPLAGFPILIHFLSKRRLPEIRFPTVMFLRALEPREIRRLRLREILLLILRTLAILLLVCAFARPSVQPKDAAARAAAAVAVVIDDSESMGAMDEQGRPRIEGARERGLAIVDAARGGDEIAITTTTGPDAPSERRSVRARLGDALIGGGDVTLQADESRWASLPIDWRAGAGAAAEIKGKAPVVVESDVDALAGDDRRFAVLGAPRRLRVLRLVESRAGE